MGGGRWVFFVTFWMVQGKVPNYTFDVLAISPQRNAVGVRRRYEAIGWVTRSGMMRLIAALVDG